MTFDDLDGRMRPYETAGDLHALPGVYLVARLDGRSFTRLTKETYRFEAPFDPRFRDLMLATADHLMTGCGCGAVYAHTQSDEVSVLLDPREDFYARKLRKVLSVLAGEASARFSLSLGGVAAFDCRVSQLPTAEHVVDYFRWRSEDAHRNALNAHCYWLLRRQGRGGGEAGAALHGLSVGAKNEMLFRAGVNFNDLPRWQKRGAGLYWEAADLPAPSSTGRPGRRLRHDLDLPMRDEYSAFLRKLVPPIRVP